MVEFDDVEIISLIDGEKMTVDKWDAIIDKHYNSWNHWDYAYICEIDVLNNIDGNTKQDVKTFKKFGFNFFTQDTNDEYHFFKTEKEALEYQMNLWEDLVSFIYKK